MHTRISSKRRTTTMSFLSDMALYDMSYTDIFVMSSIKSIVTFHMPYIVMYRMMKFSYERIANFLLFNIFLKTAVDAFILTHQ